MPGKETVQEKLDRYTLHSFDLLRGGAVLEPGAVYLVPLMESLNLPARIFARGNPRSTTGRLDIFTRLITDRSDRFDDVAEGYRGPLFLEIFTRSFAVRVDRWMSLSQIRLIRDSARCADEDIESLYARGQRLLYEGDQPIDFSEIVLRQGLFLRVDLRGIDGTDLVAYRAKRNTGLLDLRRIRHYSVFDFWEPVFKTGGAGKMPHVILERGEFYLLTSKERVSLPPTFAAEMAAFEQPYGELRTHYAGFFDPGFGYSSDGDLKGTPAVMEVRALDGPFMIEDGQRFCRLQLEKMSAAPDYIYGGTELGSAYQHQGLTPSKHFRVPETKEIKARARRLEQLAAQLELLPTR